MKTFKMWLTKYKTFKLDSTRKKGKNVKQKKKQSVLSYYIKEAKS